MDPTVNQILQQAIASHKEGKIEEAEKSYKKAIELKPDLPEAHYNLGNTLKNLGRLDEAEKSYKKAIELKPDYAEAHNNLGNTLNYKGDLVAAIDSYKQALNIQPDYVEAWLNVLFPLQAIKSQTSSAEDHIPLLGEQATIKYVQVAKSILSYSYKFDEAANISNQYVFVIICGFVFC